MSDGENIGFQDEGEGEMPPEMKDHWIAAFKHAAGFGPHPGPYQGPGLRRRDPDEITDADRQSAEEEPLEDQDRRPHEAGYKKMKAAQTGGGGLAPSQMEQAAAQQSVGMQQQAEVAGGAQAIKAQAGQVSDVPPPAPGGAVGVSQPYAAQRGYTPPGVPEKGQRGQEGPAAPEAPGGAQ